MLTLRRCWLHLSQRNAVTIGKKRYPKTELKFDPTRTDGDFTSFGVLPFLQKNINDLLLKEDVPFYDGKPAVNVGPTRDQRSLLSVLGSEYSIVLKGDSQTGKSFALATYALNHALSRVPRYRLLLFHSTVDTIILVPTREMILKYHHYFSALSKDLPAKCCPEKLIAKETEEYDVEFRPLKIEFRLPDSTAQYLQTAHEDGDTTPQILVTTPQQLTEILATKRAKEVSEAKFVCVDETTSLLSATTISNNDTLLQEGKKMKYVSKLELCIRQIQSTQFESFQREVQERLRRIENNAKRNPSREDGLSLKDNTFDHTALAVNSSNNLSISNIDSYVRKEFPGYTSSSIQPNLSLLKRLIKEKRKVLYKPVKFAFICDKMSPNYAFANMAIANERSFGITNAINMHERTAQFIRSVEEKMHQTYAKYLYTKRDKDIQRFEDPITYYIENIARFSNDMRKTKKNERGLIAVGSSAIEAVTDKDYVDISFVEIDRSSVKKNRAVVRDINVCEAYPLPTEVQALIMRKLENEMFNLDNSQKTFLKTYKPSKVTSLLVKAAVAQFKGNDLSIAKGLLLVVPASTDIPKLVLELNNGQQNGTYTHYTTENSEGLQLQQAHFIEGNSTANLIISADQALGQYFPGCSNLIVFGLESLYPQFAYSTGNSKAVSGLEHVNGDLLIPFLNLLEKKTGSAMKLRFMFVLNHISKTLNDDKRQEDFQKFAELMIFNDIPRHIKTLRVTSPKCQDHVLSYEAF